MSTFEARADLHEMATLLAWGARLIGVLVFGFFVVLALTGVIDVDPRDDWFMLGFAVLFLVAMLWLLPHSIRADARLRTRGPLLEIHADAIAYGGSRFPDPALRGVLHADLRGGQTQVENTRWVQGEAFYVYFDPDLLGYRRKDDLIQPKRRQLTIRMSDFADPSGMARALIRHLETAGVTYIDCGSSTEELRAGEQRIFDR